MDTDSLWKTEVETLLGVLNMASTRVTTAAFTLAHLRGDVERALDLPNEDARRRYNMVLGDENRPALSVVAEELATLEVQLKAGGDRLWNQQNELRLKHERSTDERLFPAEVWAGDDSLYEEDVFSAMHAFLRPSEEACDWYALGRTISIALRGVMDRLQDLEAARSVTARGRRGSALRGHGIRWIPEAERWHLNGRPLHAGDLVHLRTDYHGWLPGRYESDDGGRSALFFFRLGNREPSHEFSVALTEEHRLVWASEVEDALREEHW